MYVISFYQKEINQ